MNRIKAGKLVLFLLFSLPVQAQESLKLSRNECETIFLRENLSLMAEKLKISKAEAMVLQAKLWPNPSLEIDEVNLWATEKQLSVFDADLQGFNGGRFGRNQQLAISVEQLVQTAGKRKKLIALEQVTADKAQEYFEDLLRNLKVEFRNGLTHLQYLQQRREVYQSQIGSITQLAEAYQNQLQQGNIPKGEYIRLKALELEFLRNINELDKKINEAQKELKLWMHLPAPAFLEVSDEGYHKETEQFKKLFLDNVLEQAKENRPDLKIALLDEKYSGNLLAYEKAQRIPDLTVKGGYDRGGSFMYNFVGFGIGIDLPLFDRNQGNIKSAKLEIEESGILREQKSTEVENEIVLAYQNLTAAMAFMENIEPDYEKNLDELLGGYVKNFTERNISLLEFIDFLDAYLENKDIILDAAKDLNEKTEELNFAVGVDLIK